MSDLEVVSALDAMERMLHGDAVEPEAIASWQRGFDAALATAERGPGWSVIATRAHALARNLDTAVTTLSAQRDELRRQLDFQAQGARALKGYKPT